MFKRLLEDIQQLSTRRSMQVSGISHSWALDSGCFSQASYCCLSQMKVCGFCGIVWPNVCSSLCCAVICYIWSWKIEGKMRMKCLQLFKLIKTPVKMILMCSSQEYVRSTKSFIELCKNISEIWVLIYFGTQRSTNQKRWCHLVTFFLL